MNVSVCEWSSTGNDSIIDVIEFLLSLCDYNCVFELKKNLTNYKKYNLLNITPLFEEREMLSFTLYNFFLWESGKSILVTSNKILHFKIWSE